MLQRMSKVVPLVLCALIALPVSAGERHSRHGDHRNHRGVIHWANIAKPWFGDRGFGDRGRRHGHNRFVRLKHFSPSWNGYRVRSVIAVSPQLLPNGYNGVYGGSYAYDTEGDTYFGAEGYAPYGAPQAAPRAPAAKVIDVARQGDPCSYEANVCVIRP
jgi:hypothetical protein